MKKLMIISSLLIASPVFAQSAATVLFTKDKVVAKSNGASRDLTRGSTVNVGDQIVTSAGGIVNLKYTIGTIVNIGGDTTYTVLEYSPNSKSNKIVTKLDSGSISSQTNTASGTKQKVVTPVTALAVLGTHFELSIRCLKETAEKDKSKCKKRMNLRVTEGTVQAGGQTFTAGASVSATSSSSIKPAPFPAAAQVNEPPGAPGAISGSSSSTSVPTSTDLTTSYTTEVTASTTLTTGTTSTTTSTAGVATALIPLSIACF